MDRFFPCTQELESLKDFERDRILGTSNASSIVFLFPSLKISRNGGVAICDVCRQPWLDRRSHMNCVRSEQVDRVQTDPDSRVLGSRFVEGERRSWRLVHPPTQKEQNSDAVTADSTWATMVTNLSVIS